MSESAKIRDEIRKCGYSFVIHLSHLRLTEFPMKIFTMQDFTCLRRLDLSNNSLSVIPEQIGQLSELRELWLQNNPISSCPRQIELCTKLEVIDFKATKIADLPPEICNIKNLHELDFSKTPFAEKVRVRFEIKENNLNGLKQLFDDMYQRKNLKAAIIEKLLGELYIKEADDPRTLVVVKQVVEVGIDRICQLHSFICSQSS